MTCCSVIRTVRNAASRVVSTAKGFSGMGEGSRWLREPASATSPFYGLDILPARAGGLIDNKGSGSGSPFFLLRK
jgi:hypothetical protein